MGIVQWQVVLAVLWIAGVLLTLWILGPMVLFLSPWRRYANDVFDDPREAERPGDPDFERRFAELKALGFVPVGKTRERFRFLTPMHWIRVWNGSRWFASPDRRVFVEIHRLASGHPQRMSANTTFEGGGLLVSSTAPSGMGGEVGERYRRVEVESDTIEDLVRQHERQLSDFSREAGLRVKAATLSDLATETAIITKPFVARHRLAGLYAIAIMYVMPLGMVLHSIGRTNRVLWLAPFLLCGWGILFAAIRLTVLPEYRRIRWVGFAAVAAFVLGLPPFMRHAVPRHHAGPHPAGATAPAATNRP